MAELRRALGPVMLWGLGVGYVISGMYFGWNLGLPEGGTYGMLAATLLVTVMYLAFSLSYAELACAIPRAGGAMEFGLRAFGPGGGLVLGVAQIVEFLFAPPAIAKAIGDYFRIFLPDVPPTATAIAAYVLFTAVNVSGVRLAAAFELGVTVLAVGELLLFMGITLPHFDFARFSADPLPHGWAGVLPALPFAIWFYLGIEGVANAAEEARNPQRDVARGIAAAIATLVVLAIGVFFAAVGVGGWPAVVYPAAGAPAADRPLPLALGQVVAGRGALYHLLVTVGLLGLVASFHGIVLAAGRATFELGRSGFAPRLLGRVAARTGTPAAALAANMVIGIAAILSGTTNALITMSVIGALTLYVGSMAALLTLRRREPDLPRPFRAVAYPVFPILALVLSALCLVAVIRSSPLLAALVAAILALTWLFYRIAGSEAPSTECLTCPDIRTAIRECRVEVPPTSHECLDVSSVPRGGPMIRSQGATRTMAKLPVVSGAQAVRAFGRIGYEVDHQTGSHIILRNRLPPQRRLTIPNHRELAKGTLRALIREAGLTVDAFIALMDA